MSAILCPTCNAGALPECYPTGHFRADATPTLGLFDAVTEEWAARTSAQLDAIGRKLDESAPCSIPILGWFVEGEGVREFVHSDDVLEREAQLPHVKLKWTAVAAIAEIVKGARHG